MDVTPYIPQFFWRFWLSDADPTKHTLDDHRVHIYDVFNNVLSETRRIPEQTRTVFQDFITDAVDEGCLSALRTAEQAFTRLENEVERILADLVLKIRSPGNTNTTETTRRLEVPISKRNRDQLLRYFVFLRYRNSVQYNETVGRLTRRVVVDGGAVVNACHAWHRVRRRAVLGSYHAFLHHESLDTRTFHRFEGLDCWKFCKAEICIGIASEGQQYVLPDTCFASLDEDFGGDPTSPHLLFPVMPTLALYVLGVQDVEPPMKGISTGPLSLAGDEGTTWIDVGVESPSDVHLRNASLLQRNPAHLYFSSLTSLVQAISSYDEFRWISEHLDFSRLKQRARQKATLEKVTKTLVVKGSVLLVDLTDEVTKVGHHPVCHGGFSDVWKGVWTNSLGHSKAVALKFLRQYQNVANAAREKLLKRLKAEIVAWHRLQHPNIAPLYGVMQAVNSIAMVSPWCNNGTIMEYIQREDIRADRLALLMQVASGVSYLHNMKPIVVHGDLKGTNILISDTGDALISDFGLSNVVEELSLTDANLRAAQFGTSLLAGSTRWMAPELILTLVEDDGVPPIITTESDVFSFACVCLEVATGELPYPHRHNDRAVTIDILRGVKPSRGARSISKLCCTETQQEAFWDIVNRCWNTMPILRPTMTEVKETLAAIAGYCA
ncbi:kinase-like domain-containing protein [Melanogaster broomeanus]|nr:kinase-like domain-containing protein [Melanogaster broomeanus]